MRSRFQVEPALVVVLAGISAAVHVGKLSPALPILQRDLGLPLVQAGFLLSLVQLAGMTLGLLIGLAADGWGLRRSMLGGLVLLGLASLAGGRVQHADALLWWRAVEGLGFLLAVLPAPSLIRRLVPPQRMSIMLGMWGAYMPVGTALALLLGPMWMGMAGWSGWWDVLGVWSLGMAVWLWRVVPPDPSHALPGGAGHGATAAGRAPGGESWTLRLRQTLLAPGPWLVALIFAMYSGQWLAVVGFLPTMYAAIGVAPAATAVLTALVAAANMLGNLTSGRLLARGVAPQRLLYAGFCVMGLGTLLAFADLPWGMAVRFVAVLLFSMVGGMIPGTLFSVSVRVAPNERTVSTTVGWMQQWSALGQFAGAPLVAWVAAQTGGWQWTWLVTGGCSLLGLWLAWLLGKSLKRSKA